MLGFRWRKKLLVEREMRAAIAALTPEDPDIHVQIVKVMAVAEMFTKLADAFDKGWRIRGKSDLNTIPELKEFGDKGFLGTVYPTGGELFD